MKTRVETRKFVWMENEYECRIEITVVVEYLFRVYKRSIVVYGYPGNWVEESGLEIKPELSLQIDNVWLERIRERGKPRHLMNKESQHGERQDL